MSSSDAGSTARDNGGFYRFDAVPVAVVGPDEEQRAVGQDWAACLVYLPLSGDAAAPLRIDHSLRGAWQHPVDSRLFTVCWEQAVPFLVGNCWAAHPFEVLGAARLPAGTTPEAATAACREFTVATLGSPAALDRGDLDVQLLPIRPDPNDGNPAHRPGRRHPRRGLRHRLPGHPPRPRAGGSPPRYADWARHPHPHLALEVDDQRCRDAARTHPRRRTRQNRASRRPLRCNARRSVTSRQGAQNIGLRTGFRTSQSGCDQVLT